MAQVAPPSGTTPPTPPRPGTKAPPLGTYHHAITQQEWQKLEQQPEFRELVAEKRGVIVPATIFFILYYFALPVLVGYFPHLMDREVIGHVNIAYLFALSQFFVAWGLAFWYLRRANRFDAMEKDIRDKATGGTA